MQNPIVKCYTPNSPNNPHCFYILCKGDNSGKPLDRPCPNCFVVICSNQTELDYIRVICYGLHQSRIFRQDLIGSCIQFIRIGCFKKRLFQAIREINGRESDLSKLVDAFQKVQLFRKQIMEAYLLSESRLRHSIKSLIR